MMKDARAFGRSNPTGYLPAARKTDGHAGVVGGDKMVARKGMKRGSRRQKRRSARKGRRY